MIVSSEPTDPSSKTFNTQGERDLLLRVWKTIPWPTKGTILLNQFSFWYPGSEPVINDLSLEFSAG